MGQFYTEISDDHADWIRKQKLFFVASAPLDDMGRVNVSPKGYDCLRVLSPNKVCYLELTGSGVETVSHVKENQRLTFMFAAFEGAPRIMRLFCRGSVHENGSPEFESLFNSQFKNSTEVAKIQGVRSIIVGDVYQVGTSCGFAVPFMDFKEDRKTLATYWNKRSDEELQKYWKESNAVSLDGVPALGSQGKQSGVKKRAVRVKVAKEAATAMTGFALGVAATVVVAKYLSLSRTH